MNRTYLIGGALAILGLGMISGPSALHSAQLAKPPLEWSDLAIIFAGCSIGMFVLLAFWALARQFQVMRGAWWLFGANAVYFLGTGISSLAIGLISGAEGPAPALFFVIGMGITIALALCRALFRSAFAT